MTDLPEPAIRERAEHCISRRDIDPDALKVLYRLARHGHTAYLVGGGVRDLLLERTPKDFDIGTSAHPNQIKRLFRNCFLIGRRFRLAHIKYGDKVIETSTFRSLPEHEGDPTDPEADLFQKDDNEYGTPAEDAWRRDFTINGLFYDIETFQVIDYVGGLPDLEAGRIRCIGDPEIRFREDPVRMVRAVRFAGRLGFTIEEETFDAIKRHASEIEKASPPRMLEEIYRLFSFQSGAASMKLLHETGLFEHVFPELASHLAEVDGADERLWRYLAALDAGDAILTEPTPALIFGSLYYDYMQHNQNGDGQTQRTKWIREKLSAATDRFRIPKRVLDRLGRVFAAQSRFDDSRKRRFSKSRFVAQESFPEALSLYEIHVAATDADDESAKNWLGLYNDYLEKTEKSDSSQNDSKDRTGSSNGGTSSKRRRRRRGGRRRRKTDTPTEAQADESKAEEPKAADKPEDAAATETEAPPPKKKRSRRRRKKKSADSTPAKTAEAIKRAGVDDGDTSRPLSPTDFYIGEKASAPTPEVESTKTSTASTRKPTKEAEPEPRSEAKPISDVQAQAPHWLDEI